MLSNSVSNISNSSHNMEFVRIMLFKKWNMPDVVCHFDHMVMPWLSFMKQKVSFKHINVFTMVSLLEINILSI